MFAKALAFGLGAAIAGSIIYYAVIALLDLEIGIVAILIGYMVGYAVRKASRGFGARRYQVLAAVLTYFAVGLAYMPLALKGAWDKPTAAKSDSSAVASRDSATTVNSTIAKTDSVPTAKDPSGNLLLGIATILYLAFALPILIIVGSMPSGLLSAAIIGFGIMQAWKMTAELNLAFAGPLKVAPPAPVLDKPSV